MLVLLLLLQRRLLSAETTASGRAEEGRGGEAVLSKPADVSCCLGRSGKQQKHCYQGRRDHQQRRERDGAHEKMGAAWVGAMRVGGCGSGQWAGAKACRSCMTSVVPCDVGVERLVWTLAPCRLHYKPHIILRVWTLGCPDSHVKCPGTDQEEQAAGAVVGLRLMMRRGTLACRRPPT